MFWALIAVRLKCFWNALWRVGWSYRFLALLALLGIGVFCAVSFGTGYGLFRALAAHPEWGGVVAEIVLFFSFSAILLFFFISTASSAVFSLFLSGDLEFLFSLPLPARIVFAAKLVESLALSFAFLPLLFLPFLIGYGIGYGAPFYFYFAAVLILAALLVWGSCFGFVLSSFLARILPRHRAREIMTAAGALLAVAFALGMQLFAGEIHFRNPSEWEAWSRPENWKPLLDTGENLLAGGLNYFPSAWAKEALLWSAGQGGSGLYFLLLLGSGAVLFGLVVFSAEKVYLRGWLAAGPKAKKQLVSPAKIATAEKFFSPFWGVMKKDWQTLKRDWNQIIPALIMPAMMVALPLLTSAGIRQDPEAERFMPFFILLFAGIVALQNGLRAVPWERLSMSQILVAPLPMPVYIRAKLAFASLCTLAELWVAAILLTVFFSLEVKHFLLGLWLSFFIASSAGAIGLWIGTVFARWDWDKPNHMVTPGGAFTLAGIILLYGLLWAGLLTAGVAALKFLPFVAAFIAASIIYGAVSFFLVWLFGLFAVKRLENLEWKFG
ncbi:MAG TPA: hypothetical protein VNL73_11535 [Verrucomicrobiae bacterium]|nr:hypothetical protein [Verrucomicrobiae bacterium]